MDQVAVWYQTLDLEPGASSDDVRNAWRDLAQVWHPDRFPHNDRLRAKAEHRLQQINEAYEALKDYSPAEQRTAPESYRPAPEGEAEQPGPLEVLAGGVRGWNLWRNKYSDVLPDLRGAELTRRSLEGVDFRECDLRGANLQGADLYKANLSRARLDGARLAETDFSRGVAHGSKLEGVDFTGAELSSTDFRGAVLRGALFEDARLVGARFEAADLSGSVGLDAEKLSLCTVDGDTRLP